jgi:hypothetical protein
MAVVPKPSCYRTPPFPIDMVITWVYGGDADWVKRHNEARLKNGFTEEPNHRAPIDWDITYAIDNGWPRNELFYNVVGASRNLTWIRRLYLVIESETHTPPFLQQLQKIAPFPIVLVYHRDIIPATMLPTYNSLCIEFHLDQIPGISDQFIYANDDTIAVNPMSWREFFTSDGKIRVCQSHHTVDSAKESYTAKKSTNLYDTIVHNTFTLITTRLKTPLPSKVHRIYSMRKDSCAAARHIFCEAVQSFCITPLRCADNVCVQALFVAKPEMVEWFKNTRYDYIVINGEKPNGFSRILKHAKVACMNNFSPETPLRLYIKTLSQLRRVLQNTGASPTYRQKPRVRSRHKVQVPKTTKIH